MVSFFLQASKKELLKNFEFRGYMLYEQCTVGKIYAQRVVKIAILGMGPVSNESLGNFTFYRGILEFLKTSTIVKITVF